MHISTSFGVHSTQMLVEIYSICSKLFSRQADGQPRRALTPKGWIQLSFWCTCIHFWWQSLETLVIFSYLKTKASRLFHLIYIAGGTNNLCGPNTAKGNFESGLTLFAKK